jgi:tRNA(Ile)-lysidine synthase
VSDFVDAVERTILARQLLRRGQSILVAVSGGLDSMVLLHVLHSLSTRNQWRLAISHFNHHLRGVESDADEQFVRNSAAKLSLAFVRGAAHAATFARRKKVSIEMAARQVRHQFLARTARRLKIGTVALAHHADDQIELFFLRLLRGASGEGLAGMRWAGPSPSDPKVQLVRPLLDQPKAALRMFAEQRGIAFREDATNAQGDFLRNRVRNKLLPLLARRYQPALARTVLRTMEVVGAEADFARKAAEKWLQRKRPANFDRLHTAVQRQVIHFQLLSLGIVPDFDLIEQLRRGIEQPISIGPELAVFRDRAGRIAQRSPVQSGFQAGEAVLELNGSNGKTSFDGIEIRWEIISANKTSKRAPAFAAGVEYFDADKVSPTVLLRHWRPGDRFQPIGLSAPVKLQDLFSNARIPRSARHQLVVATTATGELFWVEGLRIAERFKLDKRTLRRLKWRWSRGNPVLRAGNGRVSLGRTI